jgi:translation initiation factor IF-2
MTSFADLIRLAAQGALSKKFQELMTLLGKDPHLTKTSFKTLHDLTLAAIEEVRGHGLSAAKAEKLLSAIKNIEGATNWEERKKVRELARLISNFMLAGMDIEKEHGMKVVKGDFSGTLESYIERLKSFTVKGDLKEIVMSIASDINKNPSLDKHTKNILIGLSMDYKNKGNLSKEDVLTFIDYIKKFI